MSPAAASGSTAQDPALEKGLQDICCGAAGQGADKQSGCGGNPRGETSRCGRNGQTTSENTEECGEHRTAHEAALNDVGSGPARNGCCASSGGDTLPSDVIATCGENRGKFRMMLVRCLAIPVARLPPISCQRMILPAQGTCRLRSTASSP